MQRAQGVGVAVGAAVLGALALLWIAMPDTGEPVAVGGAKGPAPTAPSRATTPAPVVPSVSVSPAAAAPRRATRRAAPTRDDAGKQRARTEAAQREGRAGRTEPRLAEDEKAQARRQTREEISDEIRERVDAYAMEAGWDAQTHAEVKAIFEETSQKITRVLGKVDRGELEWNDVRRELRQYRLDSAAEVEGILGPEAFRDFTGTMDFQRFQGDEPVRGRL